MLAIHRATKQAASRGNYPFRQRRDRQAFSHGVLLLIAGAAKSIQPAGRRVRGQEIGNRVRVSARARQKFHAPR
jgi:hypothetical protein